MVAVTYGIAAGKTAGKAVDTQKSWFRRLLKAMMESREEQARREIQMYTRISGARSTELPFGGW
jgi:hypothetical protein